MNKYDGLIERVFVGNDYVGCNIKSGAYDSKEDMKTLQDLLERATPKKPKDKNNLNQICPVPCPNEKCNHIFGYVQVNDKPNYCLDCGQSLKWSE